MVVESRYNVWLERNGYAYVFNSVSGSLYRMTVEQRTAFQRYTVDGVATAEMAETLAHLIAGGMLISDDVDELARLATRYQTSRDNSRRFSLTIVTSLGCNFDCPYCFEAKHPSIMDEDVRGHVLRVLDDQLPHIDTFGVSWFGGEPLVGRTPLFELSDAFIERCDARGVRYQASIVTNGYLLDEETCRGLAERRVVSAQVGLDGPPEIHDVMRPLAGGRGTFTKIVENLKVAVDYLGVSVRVNVDARNFDRVEALFEILANEGLSNRLSVYPVTSSGRGPTCWRRLRTTAGAFPARNSPARNAISTVLPNDTDWPPLACPSRRVRRARRSGVTNSSSAVAESCTNAGNRLAIPRTLSGTSATTPTRTVAWRSGWPTTRSRTRTARPASRYRPAWAAARCTRLTSSSMKTGAPLSASRSTNRSLTTSTSLRHGRFPAPSRWLVSLEVPRAPASDGDPLPAVFENVATRQGVRNASG